MDGDHIICLVWATSLGLQSFSSHKNVFMVSLGTSSLPQPHRLHIFTSSFWWSLMLHSSVSTLFLALVVLPMSSSIDLHSLTGDLVKLQIEHDNSGFGAAWMLDHIEVTNLATNQRWAFPCGQWFDKKRGDGQISRELLPRD